MVGRLGTGRASTVLAGLVASGALALVFAPSSHAATGDLAQKAPTAGCVANTGTPGGCADAEALGGAFSVTVSPDGNHAYVVASNDNAVSIFDRNASTGAVNWKGCLKDALEPDRGLCNYGYPLPNPRSMAISPDGEWAYVVSSQSDQTIAGFRRNPATGLLTPSNYASLVSATGAGSITISPAGENIYVASSYSEISPGEEGSVSEAVSEFNRDAVSGELGSLSCISEKGLNGFCEDGAGLKGATSVAVSPDGKHVYVASRTSNAIASFSRDASTGELTDAGVFTATGLTGPESVIVSPDGKSVYAAANSGDAVVVFDRNAVSGALTQKAPPAGCISDTGAGGCTDGEGLNGSNSVTVSPDGESVYVGSLVSDAVALFDRNTSTGALTQKPGTAGCISSNAGLAGVCETGIGLNGIRSLIVSPDGKNLYTAASVDGAIAIFDRETPPPVDPPVEPPVDPPVDPPVAPPADTTLKGSASAKKKQKQKGKKIVVKAKAKASEDLTAKASGKVKVGKKSYKLKPQSTNVSSGKSKTLKLKPKKKGASKIARALKKGKKAKAKLTVKLTDAAGNKKTTGLSAKLKR